MTNSELSELLRAVAAAYQIKGEKENRFKIIAYQRAADAVEHASSELKDLWDEGKLLEIAGIGKNIAQHIDEIFRTGRSKHFDKILSGLPPQMFEIMIIPGIGAKTAFKLTKELNLDPKDPILDLEKRAKLGEIARLEGFGEESQRDILRAIQEVRGRTRRHLLPYATRVASEVIEWLLKEKKVEKACALGSLRRCASTVGDIDIAVASDDPDTVIEHFISFPNTKRVIEKGKKTASIVILGDVQVDLMVQPSFRFGALLQHFTGSKHHNIALREYALKKGFSLSEYGIRKRGTKGLISFKTEEEFYNFLGLDYIPPELRENQGEIEAALNKKLPNLVELKDIKGDLQIHSSFDVETSHDLGASSMIEIVKKADQMGYQYIAFTEHNPSQKGHNEAQIIKILKMKKEEIEQINYSINNKSEILGLNKKHSIKKVFNSLEIDIKPNGTLAIPIKALDFLDFALCSIHSSFKMPKKEMTKRILAGLSHPKVKILAHPTARLLGKREGIEADWEKIFDYCIKNNKWVEINADPARLDLPDFLVRDAVKRGVKLTLGTDAHSVDGLTNMQFGVSVARRGWAEKGDIVNSRDLENFLEML